MRGKGEVVMTDGQKKSLAYRIKDYVTIISALAPFIGVVWLWVNVFSQVPARIDKLEANAEKMQSAIRSVEATVVQNTFMLNRIDRKL